MLRHTYNGSTYIFNSPKRASTNFEDTAVIVLFCIFSKLFISYLCISLFIGLCIYQIIYSFIFVSLFIFFFQVSHRSEITDLAVSPLVNYIKYSLHICQRDIVINSCTRLLTSVSLITEICSRYLSDKYNCQKQYNLFYTIMNICLPNKENV